MRRHGRCLIFCRRCFVASSGLLDAALAAEHFTRRVGHDCTSSGTGLTPANAHTAFINARCPVSSSSNAGSHNSDQLSVMVRASTASPAKVCGGLLAACSVIASISGHVRLLILSHAIDPPVPSSSSSSSTACRPIAHRFSKCARHSSSGTFPYSMRGRPAASQAASRAALLLASIARCACHRGMTASSSAPSAISSASGWPPASGGGQDCDGRDGGGTAHKRAAAKFRRTWKSS